MNTHIFYQLITCISSSLIYQSMFVERNVGLVAVRFIRNLGREKDDAIDEVQNERV